MALQPASGHPTGCHVLVVDSNNVRRALFLVTLPPDRYTIALADTVEEALTVLEREPVELAVVAAGAHVRELHDVRPKLPVILMDPRYVDESLGRVEAPALGADAFLGMPFDGRVFEARAADARQSASKGRGTPAGGRPTLSGTWEAFRKRAEDLHTRLEKLDYYQLLGAEVGAAQAVIKTAYYARAMEFHPDRFLTLKDAALREKIYQLFKRISEAFKVLADPQKRQEYDAGLTGADRDARLRYVSTARPRQGPRDPTEIAKNANARKFYGHALVAEREGNVTSARMYLTLALQHEPGNETIEKKLEELKGK